MSAIIAAVAVPPVLSRSDQRPVAPGRVRKKLYLEGNWSKTRITQAILVGNGNRGSDCWATDFQLSGSMPLKVGDVLFDRHVNRYSFTVEIDVSYSDSREVAGVFRFLKGTRRGVFAAAFLFPEED